MVKRGGTAAGRHGIFVTDRAIHRKPRRTPEPAVESIVASGELEPSSEATRQLDLSDIEVVGAAEESAQRKVDELMFDELAGGVLASGEESSVKLSKDLEAQDVEEPTQALSLDDLEDVQDAPETTKELDIGDLHDIEEEIPEIEEAGGIQPAPRNPKPGTFVTALEGEDKVGIVGITEKCRMTCLDYDKESDKAYLVIDHKGSGMYERMTLQLNASDPKWDNIFITDDGMRVSLRGNEGNLEIRYDERIKRELPDFDPSAQTRPVYGEKKVKWPYGKKAKPLDLGEGYSLGIVSSTANKSPDGKLLDITVGFDLYMTGKGPYSTVSSLMPYERRFTLSGVKATKSFVVGTTKVDITLKGDGVSIKLEDQNPMAEEAEDPEPVKEAAPGITVDIAYLKEWNAIACSGTPKDAAQYIEYYIAGVEYDDVEIRREAANLLSNLAERAVDIEPAVGALVGALGDEDERVRLNAENALFFANQMGIELPNNLGLLVRKQSLEHESSVVLNIRHLLDLPPKE